MVLKEKKRRLENSKSYAFGLNFHAYQITRAANTIPARGFIAKAGWISNSLSTIIAEKTATTAPIIMFAQRFALSPRICVRKAIAGPTKDIIEIGNKKSGLIAFKPDPVSNTIVVSDVT
jgi:hypothetical protein